MLFQTGKSDVIRRILSTQSQYDATLPTIAKPLFKVQRQEGCLMIYELNFSF